MKKQIYILVGLTAIFSVALMAEAQAGSLVNPTITATTLYGGRVADYTATFEVASSTEIEAQIRLIFPSGFTIPSTVASSSITASSTGSSIVATSTVSGQEITIWLADGSVTAAGETIQLSGIPSIQSPYAGGSQTFGIETRTQANALSDDASSTAVTFISSPKTTLENITTPTDTISPTSFITTPSAATSISAGEQYVIKGTASDAGGSSVQKVEVSVDGGDSWLAAERDGGFTYASAYKWKYVWESPEAGEYTVQARATDTVGNVETAGSGVKVTVTGAAVSSTPAPTPTPTPAPQTTIEVMQAQIATLQQQVLGLLQQLVQMLTAQL